MILIEPCPDYQFLTIPPWVISHVYLSFVFNPRQDISLLKNKSLRNKLEPVGGHTARKYSTIVEVRGSYWILFFPSFIATTVQSLWFFPSQPFFMTPITSECIAPSSFCEKTWSHKVPSASQRHRSQLLWLFTWCSQDFLLFLSCVPVTLSIS